MDAFIFQADIYCQECGEDIAANIPFPAHAERGNESTWDSDEYPKGPYANGGGEADTPQHCACCRRFLQNPLTSDGEAYVREQADMGMTPTVREWVEFYGREGVAA